MRALCAERQAANPRKRVGNLPHIQLPRAAAVLLLAVLSLPLQAHNGPPFPIIVDKRIGPCVVSLWTHPDIGIGTFWVIVDPPPGGSIPKDLKIQVAVQPINGRIAERRFAAAVDDSSNQLQYKVEALFDRQEFIHARVILKSAAGSGEAMATVEVTPTGFGRWDLLFFLLPFLGAGFLWFRAMTRRRKRSTAMPG